MKEYQTTIKVSVGKDGKKMEERAVLSYMVGEYLAVHEDPDDQKMFGEYWSVTHVPTGYAVRRRIETKEWAVELANNIVDLMDWNFDEPEAMRGRPGLDLVLNCLYPDREAKPVVGKQKVESVVGDVPDKLTVLAENEGFDNIDEFLLEFGHDSVVPGICMNDGCDYTISFEPDCTGGWCEICETNTVQSGLILAGLI